MRKGWQKPVSQCLVLACSMGLRIANAEEPGFKLNRYDEDYAWLRDAPDDSVLQRIKFIPIGSSAYLSFGGELRERYDAIDAPRYGIATVKDSYLLQRVMLHADAHLSNSFRLFVQFGQEDAYGKNRPVTASDADRFDLANAFIDVKPSSTSPLSLRAGRQELFLNASQRFVSVREGPNVRQSFDGARLTWADTDLRIETFATRPVAYKPDNFDDSTDRTQSFSGIYGSKSLSSSETLDAYLFLSGRNAVRFGTTTGDERRQTWGVRWAGKRGPVDFDVESAYQSGRFAGRLISAWTASAIAGYTSHTAWSPRVAFEVDAGSGDKGNGRLGTFNPLFPKGAYFNESSTVSWANLVAVRPSLTLQPRKDVSLAWSVLGRWRQSGRDAVYIQPYVPITATLGNTDRHVGETYQFDAVWKANRNTTLSLQVLHATAGLAIREAGGRPMNFGMVIGQLRF